MNPVSGTSLSSQIIWLEERVKKLDYELDNHIKALATMRYDLDHAREQRDEAWQLEKQSLERMLKLRLACSKI